MALLIMLRRMNRSDMTVHGFCSTFRDRVAETTEIVNEVAEAALSQAIGNAVDRGRKLMEAWAVFVTAHLAEGESGRALPASNDR